MTTRAILAAIICLGAGLASAQPPGGPPPGEGRQGAVRERLRGAMGFRGDRHTTGGLMSGMRQFMQAELRNVPALEEKWRMVQEIQQERASLAEKREAIARSEAGNDRDQLARFHETLMAEDRLTSRQEELARAIAADADKIRSQALARRQQLQAEIDKALQSAPAGTQDAAASEDTRRSRAAIRVYDLILDRMDDLGDSTRPANYIRLFSRAMWSPGEWDPAMVEQARHRLQQLEQDQDDLRRRMDSLQGQITELKEMMEIVGSLRPQPGGEAGRGKMRGQRRPDASDAPQQSGGRDRRDPKPTATTVE